MQNNILTWLGILFCISQSAIFSGLNLAFFSLTRLRLEIEASHNNKAAIKILKLRKNSNFLLTTTLWGNVGINVLLTLLSKSVLAGISAFIFSTVIITLVGEIIPQAYFSRHALKMASLLSPLLRFYQIVLYPVAKSSALLLDLWLGHESIQYFKEKSIKELIKRHIDKDDNEIDWLEGIGAINFLTLDDMTVSQEGEPVNPRSIITLPIKNNLPVFPVYKNIPDDPFLSSVNSSGEKWVIITNETGNPVIIMDADGFLRNVLFDNEKANPLDFCHYPIVVNNPDLPLGDVISKLKITHENIEADLIDHDVILLWGKSKQIITGSDILGRLLKGIIEKQNKNIY